ncbi:MAG TPA: PEGA domain-containing protein [Acidobacteriaceae bacterium]|nr:PEGA domain-containing protein [Acidobacteriaceae bacterium]
MMRKNALLLGNLFLLCAAAYSQTSGGLTLAQLERLIRIPSPDNVIASQIQSRGVAFKVNQTVLNQLIKDGAGPQTLAQMNGRIEHATILLAGGTPGASILLDGKTVGRFPAGTESITVDPGKHHIAVQLESYYPLETDITLANRDTYALHGDLKWAGGLLTIAVQPPGASVSVTGAASYSGPQSSTRVLPGNYTVVVSQPGYVTQSQSFAVSAGESHQETVELKVDAGSLAASVKTAEAALRSGDVEGALRAAGEAYSLDPSNGTAAKTLAEASFAKGDAGGFLKYGLITVHDGLTVSVPMMHVRNFPKRTAEAAVMTISKTGAEFSCTSDGKCQMPKSVAFDCIYNLSAMNDTAGTPVLHITYSDKPHSSVVHDLDFVPAGSVIEKEIQQPGSWLSAVQTVIKLPPNAGDQYREIIQFINNVRR